MKREAREQAERIFLKSQGKMSHVEIAKKVGVNPITVGKWKNADDWATKLSEKTKEVKEKAEPGPVRKKDAHDRALKMYMESEGKIANTQLASTVGVSATTIAKWKGSESWAERPTKVKATISPAPQVTEAEQAEEIEIDLDALACLDNITRLNKRIEDMLGQTHLSPTDLKSLAEANESVLRAVNVYLDIVERACEE
jgi:uncharacterized protein YjcR